MKRETQELLKTQKLLDQPEYSTEDLQDIATKLAETKDEKAGKVFAFLMSTGHEPFLFEAWCENANEEYDYSGLFFSALEDIPCVIADMTALDAIEDVVVRWRLSHNK